MASGKTERKHIPFPQTTDDDKLCADQQEAAEHLDTLNDGQQDYLQAGTVGSEDWDFTATISSSTGELGSSATTGGVAWLPDPVVEGALMRSVTSAAKLEKLKPGTLPATGKYMTIGVELTPSSWGAAATVSVKSGVEKSTQAEAESASPAVTSGTIRVRDVVVKNTSAVYSIVTQTDKRRSAQEVKGSRLGEGTMKVSSESAYTLLKEAKSGLSYEPSATRPTLVIVNSQVWNTGSDYQLLIYVGGIEISHGDIAGATGQLTCTFLCPPGVEWKPEYGTELLVQYSYLAL